MNPVACTPCCATPQSVDIPGTQGDDGDPGTNGTNGVNAFTITTADFEVPLVGSNVLVSVANSTWMVVGQKVIMPGPATFEVVSTPTTTSALLKFMGYSGDVSPGATISAGSKVSPSGVQGPSQTSIPSISNYNVAEAQALTNSFVQIGASQITLANAGTYMIFASVRLDFSVATFNASETVNLKLRETLNGPADVANAVRNLETGSQVAKSETFFAGPIPAITYTAAAGDVLQLWGMISDSPYSGAVNVIETAILAVRIF